MNLSILLQKLICNNVFTLILLICCYSHNEIISQNNNETIIYFDYIYFDIEDLTDTTISISEKEIEDYYNSHKNEFNSGSKASLNYVIFPIIPDKNDSDGALQNLSNLKEKLEIFHENEAAIIGSVKSNSETEFNPENYYSAGDIYNEAVDFLIQNKSFAVSDIMNTAYGFHFLILFDKKEGTDECVKASHILIEFGDDTKNAKLKADSIIAKIQGGIEFSEIAVDYSDDIATKYKGGNLGWFSKDVMVKEFEDAAFNGKINDIIGPVKTMFGWHIIKVENKTKKIFRFAEFKKTIKLSDSRVSQIEEKANDFAELSAKTGFIEASKDMGMEINRISDFTEGSFIPGFGFNNEILQFSFNNPTGTISKPIITINGIAVLQLSSMHPGYVIGHDFAKELLKAKLEKIRKYSNAEEKIKKIYKTIRNNDLSSIAANENVKLNSVEKADKTTVENLIGNEAADIVFKMNLNEISEPIKTDNGWYIIRLKDFLYKKDN